MATSMAGSTASRLRQRLGGSGPVAHGAQHAGGHEGAQRDEHAVAEVQHVHQAEHQRQARGDDEDDHAHGQPATVSVSQVEPEPTSGSASSASSRGSSERGVL